MVCLVSALALASLLPFVSPLFIPADGSTRFHVESSYEAPLHTADNAKTIDEHYIVVFHPHVEEFAIAQHHSFLQAAFLAQPPRSSFYDGPQQSFGFRNPFNYLFGSVRHTYNTTLKGYSGRFSKGAIDLLRKDPAVAYVEHDQEMHINAHEKYAPWGLARLSHKESLDFKTFNKYDYDARGGLGVTGTLQPLNY